MGKQVQLEACLKPLSYSLASGDPYTKGLRSSSFDINYLRNSSRK